MGLDKDVQANNARHVDKQDMSRGQESAVAAAAALVAGDDAHVQPLLDQFSPQSSLASHIPAVRCHSAEVHPTSPAASKGSRGLIDIPAVEDTDLPPPVRADVRELHATNSGPKVNSGLSPGPPARLLNRLSPQSQGVDRVASSPDVASLAAESLAQLPSPPPLARNDNHRASASTTQAHYPPGSYDWPTFLAAYAAGRWNPHRVPSAPRPTIYSTPATPGLLSLQSRRTNDGSKQSSDSSIKTIEPLELSLSTPHLSPLQSSGHATGTDSSTSVVSDTSGQSHVTTSSAPTSTHSKAGSPLQPRTSTGPSIEAKPIPSDSTSELSTSVPPEISPLTGMNQRRASIGSSSPRMSEMRIPLPSPSIMGSTGNTPLHVRNALFSPSAHPPPQLQPLAPYIGTPGSEGQSSAYFSAVSTMPSGPTTPDLTTAAAAMRWAASSHPSLSPLAIPSPEHELTDPMRGVAVAVPVDEVNDAEEEQSSDNGNGNRNRSGLGIRVGKTRGRRRGYYGRGKTATQTRRIWEKFIGGEIQQSSSEETDVGKSDDDWLHLPSEPVQSRRREGRASSTASILPTIEASPLGSPAGELPRERLQPRDEHVASAPSVPDDHPRSHSGSRSSSVPAPSSQPILRTASDDGKSPVVSQSDYFGLAIQKNTPTMTSPVSGTSFEVVDNTRGSLSSVTLEPATETECDSSSQSIASLPVSSSSRTSETSQSSTSLQVSRGNLQTLASLSLPNTPMHRGVLSRQSSSPLPARSGSGKIGDEEVEEGAPAKPPPTNEPERRVAIDTTRLRFGESVSLGGKARDSERPGLSRAHSMKALGSGHGASRIPREEEIYLEKGFLAPPYPRDEVERRRALRKFNIVHTTPDVNFDRIAYLTKLVFSTKIVVVSLIDEDEEWFKMESGMGLQSLPRDHSFTAHAILQRGDEPTVVLDTRRDWRFSMNPLVTEQPRVRFFAAAPLRASEGHNVGALCIMDDRPHSEFTPRQRHTLKEFAAIVMREMELWKDKIQLRIRDRIQTSMEQFTRECLEIDVEETSATQGVFKAGSMDRVYERAAKLVKKTLDVEGATVMDVSHFDVLETTKAEGAISIVCHHGGTLDGECKGATTTTHLIPTDDYPAFMEFFSRFPEGKVAEGIIPKCFRSILPTRIQHALIVPIFNIDKRPFALLCAYNTADHVKPFLEGHELSYLRAIGVIILSAVLKRRMILADKSKSLFISNISHELRTPLHGILAAAELLGDTELDDNQSSFLRTVQACGASLVETVNHVLDFTKLSGNSKNGGVENVIHPSRVDMMQLVEEAVEGCWIGHRARSPQSSEIGSVYAPPPSGSQYAFARTAVEVVIEIGLRNKGWQLICEKGGIRRVLMNLIGNSLKFTSTGYVHITLKELPRTPDTPPDKAKIELAVIDTGKGISKEFLKNQLFHPFSQENPLQSGTGLGLAIVNSIIRSESVNGQVEVSSTEGVGTEIRITFDAGVLPEDEQPTEIEKLELQGKQPTVSLIGFDDGLKGTVLLYDVLVKYLKDWWGFQIVPSSSGTLGDILVLNEDTKLLAHAIAAKDVSRPFVLLTSSRADAETMATVYDFERLGGFCRLVSKPAGPSRLRQVLKACVHIMHFKETAQRLGSSDAAGMLPSPSISRELSRMHPVMSRHASQESGVQIPTRPKMTPRANTVHPVLPERATTPVALKSVSPQEYPSSPGDTTITIGAGGTLLKSSVGSWNRQDHRRTRVLVVEDNQILRDLLTRWLKNRGYDFQYANDGREGVTAFENTDHIDIVLVDLSMPVLDGISATAEIREIEAKRLHEYAKSATGSEPPSPAKILALTGMSSLEDKRRAFEAGVDGYLVKPVAFKTLDAMFHQLGVS